MVKNGDLPLSNETSLGLPSATSTKVLALIDEPNEMQRLSSLIKLEKNAGAKIKFIALSTNTYQELTRQGLDCQMPADYGLSVAEATEQAIEWFRTKWFNTLDGKNVKEILQHEGLSIWWLVDEIVCDSKFVFGNSSAREVLIQTLMFNNVINVENPSQVWCTRRNKIVYHVVNLICRSKGIAMRPSPPMFSVKQGLFRRLKAAIWDYGILIVMLMVKMLWILLGGNLYPSSAQDGKRILVFGGDNWRSIYSLRKRAIQKGYPTLDSVFDILSEDGHTVVFVDTPVGPTKMRSIGTMKEKRLEQKIAYRPFESYLSLRTILKAFKAALKIHKDYHSLSSSKAFRESVNLQDIPLWDLVNQNLSLAFSLDNLTRLIAICEMAKRMVEIENPDGILMGGEFPSERPMVATARPKGIPTLFFQHGTYSPYHLHYNHSEGDISPDGDWFAPYCPVPDKVAVYSGYDKRNFVNRGRLAEKDVLVIGQPRYDIIARASELFNREETFSKLNLDPKKKLIVWTTDTNRLPLQENEMNIAIIYNAMKSFSEAQLIIKLHPGENQKAPLYKKNKSYNPVILNKDAITIALLYASDVMLANIGSTTIIEAMMLDKPVILMDLPGMRAGLTYVEEGAIIHVNQEDDLLPAIRDALYNEQIRARLADARRRFIREHNYTQDGQASKRVADLIIHMIEEANQKRKSGKCQSSSKK